LNMKVADSTLTSYRVQLEIIFLSHNTRYC
jgi:hypothetical protein